MRVLFYYSSAEWSGSARVFADAGRALVGRGYQVVYVCPPESAVEQRIASEGFEVVPLETEGSWMAASVRLREVLLDRFAEAVFVHTEREHLIAAWAVRLAERGAVVRRTPAGGRFEAGAASRVATWLAATGFVFTSAGEKEAAPPLRGALEPVVADVGVDVARYDDTRPASPQSTGIRPSDRLLVCVYDPTARGRAATVLRAVALLAPRHPELHLALLGAGSDAEGLRMHAAALGINRVVSHLGERDDHLAVLRAAHLGWVVADHDTGAYGALDLMALRKPVLVERGTVAQRYVADGITGIHLPAGDAPATAAALAAVLAHDEGREAMGHAGRVRAARDFNESSMVDCLERAITFARDRARWIR
jgi:glycosyltransferase involved in cell wall biosynthesis